MHSLWLTYFEKANLPILINKYKRPPFEMSLNILGVAEPGEARLPSAPPERSVLKLPKTATNPAGKARVPSTAAHEVGEERSGWRLVKRSSTGNTGPNRKCKKRYME